MLSVLDAVLVPAERLVCSLSCVSSALVSWRLVVDRLSVLFLRLLLSLQRLQHLLWWLLELHIVKLVSSYIIWVCVKEVRLCRRGPERLSPCVPRSPACLSAGVPLQPGVGAVRRRLSALQGVAPPAVRSLHSLDLRGDRLQDVVPAQRRPAGRILLQLQRGNHSDSMAP